MTLEPLRSLGIDVSVRRGLDLVLLIDGVPRPAPVLNKVQPEDLPRLVPELRPDVVAIDSPPGWCRGASRAAERELGRLGIQSYRTPVEARSSNPFYAWMRVGFRAFEALQACGFPRYEGGEARGKALEVFPHATTVVLTGCLPPTSEPRRRWRERALLRAGIATDELRSLDEVDAALAALTGLLALKGESTAVGDVADGFIVLPGRSVGEARYRRCPGDEAQPELPLPGRSRCRCGDPDCRAVTEGEFAPGHDAKRKSILWLRVREGEDAVAELKRRGWELPPGTPTARPGRPG